MVRPRLAGICNTDLELVRGYMGFHGTLGHEVVGVVESGDDRWRGKRIVSEINFACGHCELCLRDLGRTAWPRSSEPVGVAPSRSCSRSGETFRARCHRVGIRHPAR
ncbi:MAG TPA: hypothetical protein ENK57_08960 [Polyangiaceae bacterium]|nr:hypothetical protein [Polyangiaceae bacterium]